MFFYNSISNSINNLFNSIMTPKEKAEELLDKFMNTFYKTQEFVWKSTAKHFVLITVDEIISIKLLWYQKDTKELDYWKEVKQEIEKL